MRKWQSHEQSDRWRQENKEKKFAGVSTVNLVLAVHGRYTGGESTITSFIKIDVGNAIDSTAKTQSQTTKSPAGSDAREDILSFVVLLAGSEKGCLVLLKCCLIQQISLSLPHCSKWWLVFVD